MQDRPELVLTRHFFTSLFDVGFLSDDGVDSLKRALLGCLAVALALGLLLTRVFMQKYGELAGVSPDAYLRAVMADHAFLIALPMWVVAAAVGLVGHSLFPDQTDFRILMAQPLSRLTIFASKLAALLLFVGLFAAGTHLAIFPLTAFTMVGAVKTGTFVATALAFLLSTVSATLFAAVAVVAIHGLLVLFAPRARLLTVSGTVRSVLIGLLVLSLPLIGRLPGIENAFAAETWWLAWAPPAWFVGLERWLIDGTRAGLAARAVTATVLSVVIAITSYVLLYRRFDRVVLQSASPSSPRGWSRSLDRWVGRAPVRHAVRRFVAVTIRRSLLHQGLIVGLLAAAGGFVFNSLLSADWWHEPFNLRGRSSAVLTLLWAPMAMMFLAIPAIRVALSVPLDLRSNWVFRMTEDVEARAEVAGANLRVVLSLGVGVPLALIGPLQSWLLGPAAAGIIVLEAVIGWLVVEWVMADWRRIPFTCSYIPGKGFVPHMFVKWFASYLFFTFATTLLLRGALIRPDVAAVFGLMIAAAAGVLAWQRRRDAPTAPLLFDDELPMDVNPLRLTD